MTPEFKICKSGNCGITITGLELDAGSYLDETATVPHFQTYKWSESVTVNAIHSVSAEEVETLVKYEIKDHNIYPIDDSTFTMPKDGIYALNHLIVPTQVWLNNVLDRDSSALNQYDEIIYFNTEDEKFYLYKNTQSVELLIKELFEVNTLISTSVVMGIKNTFNLCYLNDCFFKLNKSLLDLLVTKCKTTGMIKELTYKRDLIWMALNAIKYSIETQQLFEAQRILDKINKCYSLCDNDSHNFKYNNCGCY